MKGKILSVAVMAGLLAGLMASPAGAAVLDPNTDVDITASATSVPSGTSVELTITEYNSGLNDLTDPYVVLTDGVTGAVLYVLDANSAGFSGDDDIDGILDAGDPYSSTPIPGETWQWIVPVTLTSTTTYVATGHGTVRVSDEVTYDVTWPDYEDEQAEVTVEVVAGDATRTPGFWQTHYDYTVHVFEEHLDSYIDLGWKELSTCEEVFGMFWAKNTRESDGSRRSALCKARVIASFHALAAILNSGLDNGAPLPVSVDDIADILGDTDVKAIKNLAETLDEYNNSGDEVPIEDDDGTAIEPADPNAAQEAADTTIADCS